MKCVQALRKDAMKIRVIRGAINTATKLRVSNSILSLFHPMILLVFCSCVCLFTFDSAPEICDNSLMI